MVTALPNAKQRKCKHPFQHVHPTYDPRWQVCDLCHLVTPRPLPAPWIEAHDAAAPAPEAPSLFADLAEEEQPEQQIRPAAPARAVTEGASPVPIPLASHGRRDDRAPCSASRVVRPA